MDILDNQTDELLLNDEEIEEQETEDTPEISNEDNDITLYDDDADGDFYTGDLEEESPGMMLEHLTMVLDQLEVSNAAQTEIVDILQRDVEDLRDSLNRIEHNLQTLCDRLCKPKVTVSTTGQKKPKSPAGRPIKTAPKIRVPKKKVTKKKVKSSKKKS